jgi:hypothetical protein
MKLETGQKCEGKEVRRNDCIEEVSLRGEGGKEWEKATLHTGFWRAS